MVEDGQARHVEADLAGVAFVRNHDRDGAAFNAVSKRCGAATRHPGKSKRERIGHCYWAVPLVRGSKSFLMRPSNQSFDCVPVCL